MTPYKRKCPKCEAEEVVIVGRRGADDDLIYRCRACRRRWWEDEFQRDVQQWLADEEQWQIKCSRPNPSP